jgi:hypothetical protein
MVIKELREAQKFSANDNQVSIINNNSGSGVVHRRLERFCRA